MRPFCLMIFALTAVGGVAEDQTARRYDVFYCVMDAAVEVIGTSPLRGTGYVPEGNELRVWVLREREADLLFRITKQGGEVAAQFVAFEESVGTDIPGRPCSILGFDVGIKVLNSHVVPLTERSPILHQLLVNGAWTLGSSEPNVALGNSMSLILERHNMGSYSIDAHDNPEIVNGPGEIAACEIIRVLDRYAAKIGLSFNPDSCNVKSGGLDPNYLPPHPATARG